jgi:hypothetical protein
MVKQRFVPVFRPRTCQQYHGRKRPPAQWPGEGTRQRYASGLVAKRHVLALIRKGRVRRLGPPGAGDRAIRLHPAKGERQGLAALVPLAGQRLPIGGEAASKAGVGQGEIEVHAVGPLGKLKRQALGVLSRNVEGGGARASSWVLQVRRESEPAQTAAPVAGEAGSALGKSGGGAEQQGSEQCLQSLVHGWITLDG